MVALDSLILLPRICPLASRLSDREVPALRELTWSLGKPAMKQLKKQPRDFPGGPVVRNPSANAGDMGSIPGPERSRMPLGNKASASTVACAPREATATRSLSTATGEKPLRAATRESPPSNEDPDLPKSKSH